MTRRLAKVSAAGRFLLPAKSAFPPSLVVRHCRKASIEGFTASFDKRHNAEIWQAKSICVESGLCQSLEATIPMAADTLFPASIMVLSHSSNSPWLERNGDHSCLGLADYRSIRRKRYSDRLPGKLSICFAPKGWDDKLKCGS